MADVAQNLVGGREWQYTDGVFLVRARHRDGARTWRRASLKEEGKIRGIDPSEVAAARLTPLRIHRAV